MDADDAGRYTETEGIAELDVCFPQGAAGPDVLAELAPGGWEGTPLRRVFDPTVEQRFEEAVWSHDNLARLTKSLGKPDPTALKPKPTFEEFTASHVPKPAEPERECAELVGLCLWDVFSDGHDVRGPDGRSVDLGTFRGTAGTLAEWLNRQVGVERYDYMDFYMGTIWVGGRADLEPVYELIFRRMRRRGLDWTFSVPQLYLADLSGVRDAVRGERPDWEGYDPSAELVRERERTEREESLADMRAGIDETNRRVADQVRAAPPPPTVTAYRRIYGRWPHGWPPSARGTP